MSVWKRTGIVALIIAAVFCFGDLTSDVPSLAGFGLVTAAMAKVGRPLTPVSVAGVARRTTRRCAAGVYNC